MSQASKLLAKVATLQGSSTLHDMPRTIKQRSRSFRTSQLNRLEASRVLTSAGIKCLQRPANSACCLVNRPHSPRDIPLEDLSAAGVLKEANFRPCASQRHRNRGRFVHSSCHFPRGSAGIEICHVLRVPQASRMHLHTGLPAD